MDGVGEGGCSLVAGVVGGMIVARRWVAAGGKYVGRLGGSVEVVGC